ncbi:hypothetical protein Tco_0313609 [Tanacetum coccineum]
MVGGNGGNQFRQYAGQNARNQISSECSSESRNGNVVAAQVEGNGNRNNGDIDDIEEVNANCILMANLKQASTSGTETDKAPVYDSDGSAEVTRAYFESLYNNLVTEVEKVNAVNRKMKETNADLTTELARYRGQEKSFEINKAKFDELELHDPPAVYDSEKTLQLAQESHDTPSVARKFLNEVKDTIVTLQIVLKHRMNSNITNWSPLAYQEFHKIIKDEIAPIFNQTDARVQNFENHFMKEATKFVREFKSLAKEADEYLDKITVLEKENERLLRAVVSQDIMSIVQKILL